MEGPTDTKLLGGITGLAGVRGPVIALFPRNNAEVSCYPQKGGDAEHGVFSKFENHISRNVKHAFKELKDCF